MKRILCYGDSNTWGLIPGTKERYPWGVRWTSLIEESLKSYEVRVFEEGLCGRTTRYEDPNRDNRNGYTMLPSVLDIHKPIDAAIIMLGTNDCKTIYHADAGEICEGIQRCLDILKTAVPANHILLISPIHFGDDVWRPEKDPDFDQTSIQLCRQLKDLFCDAAHASGTLFLAGSDIAMASTVDDEHLTEEGHQALAAAVCEKLSEMELFH